MPRVIKMPTDDELPPGAVRDFTALLFRLYKAARRPTLDDLSRHIRDSDYPATASKETIRRMLRGTTIPAHWQTVETVCRALCHFAGIDFSTDMITVGGITAAVTTLAESRWHEALDEPLSQPWAGYPPGPPEDDPGDPWPGSPPGHHPGIPAQDPYPGNSASPGQPSGIDLIRRELEDPWAPPDFDEPPF